MNINLKPNIGHYHKSKTMQTQLADFIKDTPEGRVANTILQQCVHCGLCTATCPTYQLTGDELDSPRGRIYQIKQMLEGLPATSTTQLHLDRCLTCRSCETTCPSHVAYGHLIDIGRNEANKQVVRPFKQRLKRETIRRLMLSPTLFRTAYHLAQKIRPILPKAIQNKVMQPQNIGILPQAVHQRSMILLEGCVQPTMSPNINAASLRVLNRLSISLIAPAQAGCCGAVNIHMAHEADGLGDMRRNIDVWWPLLENGAEAILINASGCGAMVKEYGYHLRNDADYAEKAQIISEKAKDIVEVLLAETIAQANSLSVALPNHTIAYHPPCTLQHGQQLKGVVEQLFHQLGIRVWLPQDAHLCCGSAGTYSFFQPEMAKALRHNKLAHLHALKPDVIVSANIGCISHLAGGTNIPVMHWIEYLDALLLGQNPISKA